MSYVSRFDLACTFRRGDLFYEEDVCCTVLEDATTIQEGLDGRRQVKWKALYKDRDVDYLITEGLEHYEPKISKEQEYFTMSEIQEMVRACR